MQSRCHFILFHRIVNIPEVSRKLSDSFVGMGTGTSQNGISATHIRPHFGPLHLETTVLLKRIARI